MKNNTLITPQRAIKWQNLIPTSKQEPNNLSQKSEAFYPLKLKSSSLEVKFEDRETSEAVCNEVRDLRN